MSLLDLEKNEVAVVKSIETKNDLKQRLYALGFTEGMEVRLEGKSFFGKTLRINILKTIVALRVHEAKAIRIRVLS